MKRNSTLLKTGFAMLASLAFSFGAYATTFTAITSGNFSSAVTWGGTAPSANLTTADNIVINTGVTVTLDEDVTINNALASIAVNGTLSGTHSLTVTNGSFTGGLTGVITIHNLTLGATSTSSYTGTATVDNMYNSEVLLSLTGNTHVNDTVGLYSGVAQLSSGITLVLGSNATIMFAGGGFNAAGGGTLSLAGGVNLVYTGTGSQSAGAELGLTGINNVTVNLNSSSAQLSLNGDLTVAGQLSLRSGSLNLNGHSLTLSGSIDTTGAGSITASATGSSTSDITLSGSAGYMGLLSFTSGASTINNLTVNTASGTYASLASNLTVAGRLTLTSGRINLTGSNNLTLTGSDSIYGGSPSSYVSTSGTGSLVANIGITAQNNARTLYVGTMNSFAPVRITNSSTTAGNFSANAQSGIYANGTSGADISATRSSVNTSWNIESDITSGANVAIQAMWSTAAQVNSFNSADVYLSHYTNGAWDADALVSATAQANGMFSVSRSGITSFSPFAVFSGYPSGINELSAAPAISSYPNPAYSTITVTVDPKNTDNIKVIDILGNQVAAYPVRTATTQIDISGLTSGVCFLSTGNSTQKFVKK